MTQESLMKAYFTLTLISKALSICRAAGETSNQYSVDLLKLFSRRRIKR
jgi:hypothetical protein